MRILTIWLINAVALCILPLLMDSIHVANLGSALVAVALLGLVNTLIRPILVILTLPVSVSTLGIFILVINALLFWMVASWFSGFQVMGFWSAFFGAMLYSIISWALTTLALKK